MLTQVFLGSDRTAHALKFRFLSSFYKRSGHSTLAQVLLLSAQMRIILLGIMMSSICAFYHAQTWAWDTLTSSRGNIKLKYDQQGHVYSYAQGDYQLNKN